jgi:hypothetical protein
VAAALASRPGRARCGAAIGLALLVVARRRRPSAPQYAAEHSGELAAAPPTPDTTGEWKIDDLERLVDEHRAAGADRVAEWEAYVFHLRQYADAEGRLPSAFDALVAETFRDLVTSDESLKASAMEADQVP